MSLIRDVAASAVGDHAINSRLPSDLAPVVGADYLARAKPALPREEIRRERLLLWARADNGALVGDQDAVEDRGEKGGEIRRAHLAPIRCQRMAFEQITFHPAEAAARPEPLWQMRLVSVDGAGDFDGTDLAYPHEVLAAHARSEQAKEPRERPIQSEILPVPVIAEREAEEA